MQVRTRSGWWYLLPIFLGVVGGIIGYFVIRHDDPKKAKNCMYLGVALTAVHIALNIVSAAVGFVF